MLVSPLRRAELHHPRAAELVRGCSEKASLVAAAGQTSAATPDEEDAATTSERERDMEREVMSAYVTRDVLHDVPLDG